MDTIIDQTSYMIDTMVGLGIVICIASVYVAVNILVSENRRNISMLKVPGYSDRKIGRIVLGSYLASMYFVRRKTRKVDAAECLKEQRE